MWLFPTPALPEVKVSFKVYVIRAIPAAQQADSSRSRDGGLLAPDFGPDFGFGFRKGENADAACLGYRRGRIYRDHAGAPAPGAGPCRLGDRPVLLRQEPG